MFIGNKLAFLLRKNHVIPQNLWYLDLSSNEAKSRITSLQHPGFNSSTSRLTGSPERLGFQQLQYYLWLDWNMLGGTLPSALANCSLLMYLSIQGNALRGIIN
uniref:Uncharacterized protein n=1 Tax=Nelumbo nucifera TaxID=4432 RepID=A0A822Y302_NELNU|nr:TPA_asm: hypothetical protein HUJ06_027399 [Nelumbo nucifera]